MAKYKYTPIRRVPLSRLRNPIAAIIIQRVRSKVRIQVYSQWIPIAGRVGDKEYKQLNIQLWAQIWGQLRTELLRISKM